MIQNFDIFNLPEIPEITLCNPSGTQIHSLKLAYNRKIILRFNALSEFEFDFPRFVDGEELEAFDQLISKRLVLIENIGYFQIYEPTKNETGKSTVKHVKCVSIDGELVFKRLTVFGGTYKLYDVLSPDETLLGKMLEYAPSWTVSYVDPTLLETYRTFDVSDTNIYAFLTSDVEKSYNCIFKFDYENKEISVYSNENATPESKLYLSFNNLIKTSSLKEISDEICTAMLVYGGGELDIRTVNPLGTNYIYNFDYFKTTEWMSSGLITALNAWESLIDTQQSTYATTLTQLKNENSNLISLEGELSDLNSEYQALRGVQAVRIEESLSYDDITLQLVAKQEEIDFKESEILSSEQSINNYIAILEGINDLLSFSNNFTAEQLTELETFIYENTYQNEYIIQLDTMSAVEVQEQAEALYAQAEIVLAKISQPRYEFNLDIANFIQLKEFQSITQSVELGSEATIELSDETLVTVVLLELSFTFDNPEDFSATFSNRLRLDNGIFTYADLQAKSAKVGASVSFDKLSWANWSNTYKNDVTSFIESSLDASRNSVISDSNQQIVIDENGLVGRRFDDVSGDYEPFQVWLTSKTIAFTRDSWETASLAIGKIFYNDAYVYGVVGDAIVGRILAGNTLRIENENNNFVLDESGATLNNADFTINSTDEKSRIYLNPDDGIKIATQIGGVWTDKFYVDTSGNIVFTGNLSGASGSFTGQVSASSGSIGSLIIDSNGLRTADGVNYLRGDGSLKWGDLAIGGGSAVFSGTIYADKIVGQIDTPQIADGAVTNSIIASGVNAGKITAGVMSGTRIYGGSIGGPGIEIRLSSTGVPRIEGSSRIELVAGGGGTVSLANYAYLYSPGTTTVEGSTVNLNTSNLLIGGSSTLSVYLLVNTPYGNMYMQFSEGILVNYFYV